MPYDSNMVYSWKCEYAGNREIRPSHGQPRDLRLPPLHGSTVRRFHGQPFNRTVAHGQPRSHGFTVNRPTVQPYGRPRSATVTRLHGQPSNRTVAHGRPLSKGSTVNCPTMRTVAHGQPLSHSFAVNRPTARLLSVRRFQGQLLNRSLHFFHFFSAILFLHNCLQFSTFLYHSLHVSTSLHSLQSFTCVYNSYNLHFFTIILTSLQFLTTTILYMSRQFSVCFWNMSLQFSIIFSNFLQSLQFCFVPTILKIPLHLSPTLHISLQPSTCLYTSRRLHLAAILDHS